MDRSIVSRLESWKNCKIKQKKSISGGCIAQSYQIVFEDNAKFFIKTDANQSFTKEANGLNELKKSGIEVPEVFLVDHQFLLLQWLETSGSKSQSFFESFGRSFAKLHRFTSENFGFYEDNYIGSTPQRNVVNETISWLEFFSEYRLLFQIKLAEKNGYTTNEMLKLFAKLQKKLPELLLGSEEPPSLLHGDLWSGNYMCCEGKAVLIDPAVYYGHREMDLAMTHLFGGFSTSFYSAYQEAYPLPDGYQNRENLYMLYHILNHLNLFGMGYYRQALDIMKSYV